MNNLVHILVDLDALLDTRLGTIHLLDPAKAVQALHNEDYYFRVQDDFTDICGIGKEEFAAAYAKRNLETIKNSVICPSAVTLKDVVIGLEIANSDHPLAKKPVVDLNIWPYEMDAETRRYIRAAVANYAGLETVVNIVSYAPEQVTPILLRNQYGAYFTYDFGTWLKLFAAKLEEIQLPRVTIFTPSLFETPVPSPEELEAQGLPREIDPLRLVEMTLSPYVGLDIMPTFMFSIYRPEKQELWMDEAYRKIAPRPDQHPFVAEEDRLRGILEREGTIPVTSPAA